MGRHRVTTPAAAVQADQLLGAEEVRDGLALEEADVAILKAISRGENVARADKALAAIRLRLEWSLQKPTQVIDHHAEFRLVDPYAEPPALGPAGPVVDVLLTPVADDEA